VITTVIFDFGGVLIEWDPRFLYRRFFSTSQEMENFLSEVNFTEWNLQQDRGRPFSEGVKELSARFPHHANLIRAYHEYWVESVGSPIPGTIEILRKVKSLGYQVYGLSNWSAETFPLVSEKAAFLNLLDGYLLSGEAGVAKPDPQIFHLLLSRVGRTVEECLFIDDSAVNIEMAKSLGFACIRFTSPGQLERDLAGLGILRRAA
jgi:2-haloacid dehalogenase